MVIHMNLIRNIKYKKGSYLVEAAMLFPIFILAVVILISIIVMIGSCEKIVFSTCQESRLEAFKVGCGQWETDNLIKLKT